MRSFIWAFDYSQAQAALLAEAKHDLALNKDLAVSPFDFAQGKPQVYIQGLSR